jgi:hypothetical protein
MKIRSELLVFILMVLIIPLLVISVQSTKSLENSAEREMTQKANSLAKECDSVFSTIEKQCFLLGKEAEEIENNPGKYQVLYTPKEYYREPGGLMYQSSRKILLTNPRLGFQIQYL